MKKVLILTVALIFVFSAIAFAGVTDSKHDMTSANTNAGNITTGGTGIYTTQVCVFCHHPHRTGATTTEAQLLWNRNGQGLGTYVTYDSGLAQYSMVGGTLASNTDLGGHHTRLCLSCHDSTQAVSVVDTLPAAGSSGGSWTGTWNITSGSIYDIGSSAGSNSLQNDHPVDFNWSAARTASGTEFPASSSDSITGGYSGLTYPLYGDKMECGTCHDPHLDTKTGGVSFIRHGDSDILNGSTLCRDCHRNH